MTSPLLVNDPAVRAEVSAAFDRYEKALTGNDVAVLDELFLDHPATVRFGAGEELFGYDEIASFRRARAAAGLDRRLERVEIVTFGGSFAVVSATFRPRRRTRPRQAVAGLGTHPGRLARRGRARLPARLGQTGCPCGRLSRGYSGRRCRGRNVALTSSRWW